MTDERMLILQMLEKGKITAQEAAALLEALHGQSQPQAGGGASDSGSSDSAGVKAKEYVDKTRERVEESIKRLRETLRHKGPSREEIDNVVRQVQRGVARVLDELPDVVSRLSNFDWNAGPGHTFEETYAGRFAPDGEIHIRVHNGDGRIHVEESDGLTYSVRVQNRVHVADEAQARALSDETIEWHASDSGFELTVGNQSKVTSKVHITLPRSLMYQAELTSEDGSIAWRDLNAAHLRLITEDGSITVERSEFERLQAHASDGSISMKSVSGADIDATSADGSIRFEGFAKVLRCRAADGSIRTKLLADAVPETPNVEPWQWDITSGDGSVHVILPAGDEYGYQVDLRASDGRVVADVPHITASEVSHPSLYAGATPDCDRKPRRLNLNVRTTDGSIRVKASEPDDEAK